jgi:hypothetical protein
MGWIYSLAANPDLGLEVGPRPLMMLKGRHVLLECLAAGCAEAGRGARALAHECFTDLDVAGRLEGGQLFG